MATIAEKMTAIGDAIRAKTGGTEKLTLDQMAVEIADINTGFPNGTIWTKSNFTGGEPLDPYYANGLWVCGSYGSGGIYYSIDGKNWAQSNIATDASICSAYYANGLWVATTSNGIYYSNDGKTWTQSNITTYSLAYPYYANNLWVIGSKYYSTDGKNWTSSIDGKTSFNNYTTYCDGTLWVSGTSSGIFYSTNGIDWTRSNITSGVITYIHKIKGLWIACSSSNGVYYSSDGQSWTQSNLENADIRTVRYANNLWVAVGAGIYYSRDGQNWSQSTDIEAVYDVYYADGIWIAGSDSSGLYYSFDGIIWTQSNINDRISSLRHANGIWVACSFTGNFYYSQTWKPEYFFKQTISYSWSQGANDSTLTKTLPISLDGVGNSIYKLTFTDDLSGHVYSMNVSDENYTFNAQTESWQNGKCIIYIRTPKNYYGALIMNLVIKNWSSYTDGAVTITVERSEETDAYNGDLLVEWTTWES